MPIFLTIPTALKNANITFIIIGIYHFRYYIKASNINCFFLLNEYQFHLIYFLFLFPNLIIYF